MFCNVKNSQIDDENELINDIKQLILAKNAQNLASMATVSRAFERPLVKNLHGLIQKSIFETSFATLQIYIK